MKVLSVISPLFVAAIFATIPVSPQVTPRGAELSVDKAQAITYGRYRRVSRRVYRRAGYAAAAYGLGYGAGGYYGGYGTAGYGSLGYGAAGYRPFR
jgi:hypothetical protein